MLDWYFIDASLVRPCTLVLAIYCSYKLFRLLPTRAGEIQFYISLGICIIDGAIQLIDWNIIEKTDQDRWILSYMWGVLAAAYWIVFLFYLRDLSKRLKDNVTPPASETKNDTPDDANEETTH